MADPTAVVVVSPDELRALIREAFAEALAESRSEAQSAPALLDRAGCARLLAVSIASVDRLTAVGMPFLRLGDVKRYEAHVVVDWFRTRTAAAEAARNAPEGLRIVEGGRE